MPFDKSWETTDRMEFEVTSFDCLCFRFTHLATGEVLDLSSVYRSNFASRGIDSKDNTGSNDTQNHNTLIHYDLKGPQNKIPTHIGCLIIQTAKQQKAVCWKQSHRVFARQVIVNIIAHHASLAENASHMEQTHRCLFDSFIHLVLIIDSNWLEYLTEENDHIIVFRLQSMT